MTRKSTIFRLRSYASPLALVAAGVAAMATLPPLEAWSDPQGGTIRGGTGSISQVDTTTTIQQNTDKLIVDWNSFDIDTDETVNFLQPGQSSIALNRVTGNAPTSISGALNANGNVWIVNENGVTFNRSARVDVGGLLATTSDIDNANFMDGNFTFSEPANPDARIVNEGQITFGEAGLAALAAPGVENHGVIAGRLGTVVLEGAEAFAIDLAGDGLMAFEVDEGATSVLNTGEIRNDGGRVLISAAAAGELLDTTISLGGLVEATSFAGHTGSIEIDGGSGIAEVSGAVRASGDEGGDVSIQSAGIWLKDGSEIDVSGAAGGGTALVGGTERGGGPGPRAQHVLVSPDAAISANATGAEGDGGTIILWSDLSTHYFGSLEATGGSAGGNGGFAEISSYEALEFAGAVDLSADFGEIGTLLLDPDRIVIAANGINLPNTTIIYDVIGNVGNPNSNNGDLLRINATSIENANAAVLLQARETVTIDEVLEANDDLAIHAGETIFVNQPVTSSGNISFHSGGGIIVQDIPGSLEDDFNFMIAAAGTLTLEADANLPLLNSAAQLGTPTLPTNDPFVIPAPDGVGLLEINGSISGATVVLRSAAVGQNILTPLDLDDITATNALTVTHTGGPIDDFNLGSISAGGANVTLVARAADDTLFDITLNNNNHDFGSVSVTGADIVIDDINALTLSGSEATSVDLETGGDIVLAGSLDVQSLVADAGGSIIDSAINGVTVTGNASLNANDDVLFDSAGIHDFQGEVDIDATGNNNNDVVIRDSANGLQLGTVLADTLVLEATGAISDTGTQRIDINDGAATVTARDGVDVFDITLDNDLNDFGTITVDGATVTVDDDNDLGIGGSASQLSVNADDTLSFGQLQAGGLAATASQIQEEGTTGVSITGNASLDAGSGDIDLGSEGVHQFATLDLVGDEVTLAESDSVTFGSVNVRVLDFSAEGVIDDGATGTITVSGAAAIDATDGTDNFDIVLDNAGLHDFQDTLSFLGNTVTITDQDTLEIVNSRATASATMIAEEGDLILDTVTVGLAGGGLLLGIAESTDTTTAIQANDILADTIILGGENSSNTLVARAAGDVSIDTFDTQTLRLASGGTTSVKDGDVGLTLDVDADRQAYTGMDFAAASFTLPAGLQELILDRIVFSADTTLSAGEIRLGFIDVTGGSNLDLTATAGNIAKLPDAAIDFEGARDPASLIVTLARPGQNEANVPLAQRPTFSNLLNVSGNTVLTATESQPGVGGNVVLTRGIDSTDDTEFGVDFVGALSIEAVNAAIEDRNGLLLDDINIASNLAIRFNQVGGGGNLTQTQAIGTPGVRVDGEASFISGDAGDTRSDIALDRSAANSFGNIDVIAGSAVIGDTDGFTIVGGALDDNLDVGSSGNDQTGPVVLEDLLIGGTLTTFVDGALQLQRIEVTNGGIDANATGSILAGDIIVDAGTAAFNAGDSLTLFDFDVPSLSYSAGGGASISNGDTGASIAVFIEPATLALNNVRVGNGDVIFRTAGTLDAERVFSAGGTLSFVSGGDMRLGMIETAGNFVAESTNGSISFLPSLTSTTVTPITIEGAESEIVGFGIDAIVSDLGGGQGDVRVLESLPGTNGFVEAGPSVPEIDEMLEVNGTTSIVAASGIDLGQTLIDDDLNTILIGQTTLSANAGDVIVEADSALNLALVQVLDPVDGVGNLTLRTNTRGRSANGSQTITQTGAISVTGTTTLITGEGLIGTDLVDPINGGDPDGVGETDEVADIILANAANSLTGTISVIGDSVSLSNSVSTSLTASQVEDTLTLVTHGPAAAGNIEISDLSVEGQSSLTATGSITGTDLDLNGITAGANDDVALSDGSVGAAGLSAGNAISMDGIGALVTSADAVNGDITITDSTIDGGFTALARNANILLDDSTLDGPLLMQALVGSIIQTDDVATLGEGHLIATGASAIIRAGQNVDLSSTQNDFQASLALFTGGTANINDVNDLSFGLPFGTVVQVPDASGALVDTTLAAIATGQLGAGQTSALDAPATSGVVGGTWTISAGQGVSFDGALDGGGGLEILANSQAAVTDTGASVRFGDLIGATGRLGDVEIRNANGVSFGLAVSPLATTGGAAPAGSALLDQEPQRDVFIATNLSLEDNVGVIETPRDEITNFFEFELTLTYFGVDLSGNLSHAGDPAAYSIDLTGALGGERSRGVGLLPLGQRGAQFRFNNCVMGDISSCSAEVPSLALPLIDLSLPNIFEIDFEALGDVYVNFGNEELWAIPTLFEDEEELQN